VISGPDPTIAEEIVAGRRAVQQAEHAIVRPIGVRLPEIEPDADAARRVDLQLAVVLDVAELLRRRVVEHEHHRRDALRQIEILVEDVGHVHWAVAAIVEQLQILQELAPLARVQTIVIGDQVILQHHYSSHLVGHPIGVWRG
jgi:hypothetical protein